MEFYNSFKSLSSLRTKHNGYEELQQTVAMLQKEKRCLNTENEQMKNIIENLTDQLEALRNHLKKLARHPTSHVQQAYSKNRLALRLKVARSGRTVQTQRSYAFTFPGSEVIDCPPIERCGCGGRVCVKNDYKSKQLVDIQVILKVKEEHVDSRIQLSAGAIVNIVADLAKKIKFHSKPHCRKSHKMWSFTCRRNRMSG